MSQVPREQRVLQLLRELEELPPEARIHLVRLMGGMSELPWSDPTEADVAVALTVADLLQKTVRWAENDYTKGMSGDARDDANRLRQEFREELVAIRAEFRQDVKEMRTDFATNAKNTQDRLDAFREENRTTLDAFRKESRDSLDAFRTETRAQFTSVDQRFTAVDQKIDKLTDIATAHTVQFAEIKASVRTATWIVGALAALASILGAIAAFG